MTAKLLYTSHQEVRGHNGKNPLLGTCEMPLVDGAAHFKLKVNPLSGGLRVLAKRLEECPRRRTHKHPPLPKPEEGAASPAGASRARLYKINYYRARRRILECSFYFR